MKQTKQAVCIVKQSIFLDVYGQKKDHSIGNDNLKKQKNITTTPSNVCNLISSQLIIKLIKCNLNIKLKYNCEAERVSKNAR